MKKQRHLDILSILLNDGFVTADEIAQKLSISNKTVRNYLQKSTALLSPFKLQLFSKIGSGYSLEGTEENKLKFRYYLEEEKKNSCQAPSAERVSYIVYQLLCSQNSLHISQLESELYISRSSLYADIEKVQSYLKRFDITIIKKPYKGILLQGHEKNIRIALYHIICEIKSSNNPWYSSQKGYDFIHSCFQDSFTNRKIVAFLHKFEQKKGIKFALKDFEYLRLMFFITLHRIQQGFYVPAPDSTDSFLDSFFLIKKIENSKQGFQKTFHLPVNDSEIYYLSTLFLSLKNTNLDYQNSIELENQCKKIVQQFSSVIYEKYAIRNHKDFENGLFYHIADILKKINYDFDFTNPYLEKIKNEFQIPYKLAKEIVPIAKAITGVTFPEDEISYIAIHIASALEESLRPLNVIFLYEHRYSELKYSASLIEAHIKEIHIIKKMKLQDYVKALNIDVHSILFTTFPYYDPIRLTYQIPVIPDKTFIKKLRELLHRPFIQQKSVIPYNDKNNSFDILSS